MSPNVGEKEKRGMQRMIDMSFESEPPANTRTLPSEAEGKRQSREKQQQREREQREREQ